MLRHYFWTPPQPAGLVLSAGLIATLAAAPKLTLPVGSPIETAAGLVLAAGLALLSAIDIRTYRLPDTLTFPLIGVGLLATWLLTVDALPWHAFAAAVGYAMLYATAALYRYQTQQHGLGLGDAKLFAASGAWLGLSGLPSVLFIASAAGLAGAAAARLFGWHVSRVTRIPFGPFLALGTWIVWLYGPIL